MSKYKRFNKFGNFGAQIARGNNPENFYSAEFAHSTLLSLENAKMQFAELEKMKENLTFQQRDQLRRLRSAFQRQKSVLSEGQLRWLQGLYDERFLGESYRKNVKAVLPLSTEVLDRIFKTLGQVM